MMSPLEEAENLLARVAMGDRAAFSRLYELTSAKLFGVCLRVLKDQSEAEDVLQNVFSRVWNEADGHRTIGYSAEVWLITITRNAALERRRTLNLRPAPLETSDLLPDALKGTDDKSVMPVGAPRIQSCLAEQPKARAYLIRRAYLDGESYSDLAEISGVDPDTIRTWLRRSLRGLGECLSR